LQDLASVSLALMKAGVVFGLAPPWSKVKVDCCGGEKFTVACGTFSYGGKVKLVQPSETIVSDQYLLVSSFYRNQLRFLLSGHFLK